MKLVNNWSKILFKSYTMWLVYLMGLLQLLPYIVPYADDFIPKWVSIVLLAVSPLARIIKQKILYDSEEFSNASK